MAISIKFPRDDVGVNSLKRANEEPGVARATDEVPPYPRVHEQVTPVQPERRGVRRERRSGRDRRQKDVPVMLDTRSPHSRRKIDRDRRKGGAKKDRRAAQQDDDAIVGVDVKV
jgi:hypothetical protein